jgi:hypothetical protein
LDPHLDHEVVKTLVTMLDMARHGDKMRRRTLGEKAFLRLHCVRKTRPASHRG